MDIEKLKALQESIDLQAKKEIYDDLPQSLINFLKDDILHHSLDEVKTRNNSNQSARVLNNWIEQGILNVDENDKGKINRFSREEAIWLNLLNELRSFGVSIEKLKIIREALYKEYFPAFTLFRFSIVRTILEHDQTLIVFSDGSIKLISSNLYGDWSKLRMLPPYIHINFAILINEIFPQNSFATTVQNTELVMNKSIVKVFYFLKTGDFDTLKFEIQEGDVRLIENINQFLSNQTLIEAIITEKYFKIEVVSNGKKFIIKA